ncbi:MAG: hypothetical protein LBF61_03975 [Azoarcus sp.]|nr:hypothetical protein [Azoarcus sp.]
MTFGSFGKFWLLELMEISAMYALPSVSFAKKILSALAGAGLAIFFAGALPASADNTPPPLHVNDNYYSAFIRNVLMYGNYPLYVPYGTAPVAGGYKNFPKYGIPAGSFIRVPGMASAVPTSPPVAVPLPAPVQTSQPAVDYHIEYRSKRGELFMYVDIDLLNGLLIIETLVNKVDKDAGERSHQSYGWISVVDGRTGETCGKIFSTAGGNWTGGVLHLCSFHPGDYITIGHLHVLAGEFGDGRVLRAYETATGAMIPSGRYLVGADKKLYFHQATRSKDSEAYTQ